jgi:hypothetical protein
MRKRLIPGVVIAVLVCGLATLELPELLQLVNDTSNDFALVVAHDISSPVVPGQKPASNRISVPAAQTGGALISHSWVESASQPCASRQDASDSLHFLCVQRT